MPCIDQLSEAEIDNVDKEAPVDMNNIQIDTASSLKRRQKTHNCFQCGEITVKLEFAKSGKSFEQSLVDYFVGLKDRQQRY